MEFNINMEQEEEDNIDCKNNINININIFHNDKHEHNQEHKQNIEKNNNDNDHSRDCTKDNMNMKINDGDDTKHDVPPLSSITPITLYQLYYLPNDSKNLQTWPIHAKMLKPPYMKYDRYKQAFSIDQIYTSCLRLQGEIQRIPKEQYHQYNFAFDTNQWEYFQMRETTINGNNISIDMFNFILSKTNPGTSLLLSKLNLDKEDQIYEIYGIMDANFYIMDDMKNIWIQALHIDKVNETQQKIYNKQCELTMQYIYNKSRKSESDKSIYQSVKDLTEGSSVEIRENILKHSSDYLLKLKDDRKFKKLKIHRKIYRPRKY